MTKRQSHVHDRSYFGEFDSAPLIAWLNAKVRPKDDPVEQLLEMNQRLPVQSTEHDVRSYLAQIVRRSKLAVAPVLTGATARKWEIDWKLVGNMDSRQGLALVRMLHLADQGLIERVRKCAKPGCGKWFFARFKHQLFDSARCQQETFKQDPAWKKQRADYMRRLRQETKLRERRWLRTAKRKGRK